MQSLAASTAVKTAPAAATVRSASAASSGLQKTEHSAGPSVAQNSLVQNGESPEQGQTAVTAYADEQALRQQQAATAQLTEVQEPASADPASADPAAEWSELSQPLSAEELALLYRQPLLGAGLSQLLPATSHQAATAAAMPDLLPQSAAVGSLGAASLAPVTLPPAQTLADPVLTERQQPALYHQAAVSGVQAFLPTAGNANQTSTAELALSPVLASQTVAAHSTLQHSSLPPALALTSLLNRQFNMVTANTASFTSNDASAANPLVAQVTTTASALAQWQSEPLPTDPARFGQRLLQLLQDKVDLQLGLGLNKALIRLDPPSLGSVELSVQLDGDKLQVQLHSSNAQLREAMGQGLEQLRASLQQKLGSELQIDLQLSADGQLPQQAHPTWLATQISSNGAEAEPVVQRQTAVLERHNYLNQLV